MAALHRLGIGFGEEMIVCRLLIAGVGTGAFFAYDYDLFYMIRSPVV